MKTTILLTFLLLAINGCSDFSSESNEFDLSGKHYACDGDSYGEIINDTKAGKKQYCNGYRWIDLIPEDSIIKITPESNDSISMMYECENGSIVKNKDLCSENPKDYLPLDDTEYPYAGLPRIVIETENLQEIKDRETEIPAKLQIWGDSSPESEILELTIRGRGNTTWGYPKKPYAIKFNKKIEFLGMPKAKKWVLLANYRDRTLIRNALAFKLSEVLNMEWTPQGKFVDVFLNKKFIGNYYICEKIEVSQDKLNINKNEYLLNLEDKFDGIYKFKTAYKKLPVIIKNPQNPEQSQISYIQNYIDSIDCFFEKKCNLEINQYIDITNFAKYWLIYEIAQNGELKYPKSVFMYKQEQGPLNLGPIWDFDWQTFVSFRTGLNVVKGLWFGNLREINEFKKAVKVVWDQKKEELINLELFIDSLSEYTRISNINNINLWPININTGLANDEKLNVDSAMSLIKQSYLNRLFELDTLLQKL
ncbi:CotH kinase family protein [Fibrobacter sp. HC4]|uniref:CotH kinase family protein n=1 Tax=Fibrobacter sp. HC4 TaxID=3239812 RepID=UPI002019E5C8|nr:CotH kinase family protein [Fibrobacter succinogenes]MCL4102586.1 hypothetical protein [Fibrobacter succinogenes]MCQ2100824.1 CotH kinase family protein [Fibrobacter sp.]